jgi:serine protease AprX
MAPDARIVSVKVADASGQTDIAHVIAAIDWVVQHRTDNGLNIRVLNLSFGTASTDSYQYDPLAYAAEQAWKHGICVVVAAGNGGNASSSLNDPATDPYVIAVGATDTNDTTNVSSHTPAAFTSSGDGTRNPDLAAPGVHIASLRVPGSSIDQQFGDTATVGTRFFRGSGTSQAAAIVSGAAALIISQRPDITPDQLKALLVEDTHRIKGSSRLTGAGELDLESVRTTSTPEATQSWSPARSTGHDGTRSRESNGDHSSSDGESRGNHHTHGDGSNGDYSTGSWSSGSWSSGTWSGDSWSDGTWSSGTWSSGTWSSVTWSSGTWSSGTWSSGTWSSAFWSASSWS